jgi:hypothetical protein
LDYLSKRDNVRFIINHAAFEAIDAKNVEGQSVQLPKMVGVSLSTVLRLLLCQIKGDVYTGTYRLRDDGIEITTNAEREMAGTLWAQGEHSPLPTIDVEFDGQSLAEALDEVRYRTGINLDMDPTAEARARWQRVDAIYQRVPAETVVYLLAEKGNLNVLVLDNGLYVAPADKIEEILKQFPATRKVILGPHGPQKQE